MRGIVFFVFTLFACNAWGQAVLNFKVVSGDVPLEYVQIVRQGDGKVLMTNQAGAATFTFQQSGVEAFQFSLVGYETKILTLEEIKGEETIIVELFESSNNLDELVVTGTMKSVSRMDCTVPVEVYYSSFFQKNPLPNLAEALQNINGLRTQNNCGVCNTQDIRINGMEGANTMVLIDGMPIVSALGTVYGFSGIPMSMVEKIEVVKGPASALYGSEAVGGLINIITKQAGKKPLISADISSTSWLEHNYDLMGSYRLGKRITATTGINYFDFNNRVDNDSDGFMDMSLARRLSIFQKISIQRKSNKVFQIGGRWINEDRRGGEMNWTEEFRGGDVIYGESILTQRWEMFGNYELPTKEKLVFSFSANGHYQDSYYGTMSYIGAQRTAFGQLTWDKNIQGHDLLAGVAYRANWYDDNTPATARVLEGQTLNAAQVILLPGLFVQDEWEVKPRHKILTGVRLDQSNIHGLIFTPRVGYKFKIKENQILRLNVGTGFRNVNVFAEDHAALTGARRVVFLETLQPERSANVTMNYLRKFEHSSGRYTWESSLFYTHFTNRIIADYDVNPEQIVYANLNGFAESRGVATNIEWSKGAWSASLGITYQDVDIVENGLREQQILTENFSAVWALSWEWARYNLSFDYTGNLYSPMRLPLVSDLDPRPQMSPWWSIQNIQVRKEFGKLWEVYGGVRNLLNYTPGRGLPFLIAGANDPFDRNVVFDESGVAVATANNPYALTFDPSYVFTNNQGRRFFVGVRFLLNLEP
ncbi:MAG: TonB-dependent receptor plug domain-containing protein [Flavobacteriales bacterium]|jgi:outer membrane receptor for ferrienterochelin and colicins